MNIKTLERIPSVAAIVLAVLVVGACAIRLRGDEDQANSSASADRASDPLTAKLAACRAVTYEQKDALSECRKVWAEKRRQFLAQKGASGSASEGSAREGSSLFVPPKDESRLPPSYFQQSGKE
jgi:conjugative transfer region protein TrbK